MNIVKSKSTERVFCVIIAVAFFRTALMNTSQFAGYFIGGVEKIEILYYIFYALILVSGLIIFLIKRPKPRKSIFLSLLIVTVVFCGCFRELVTKYSYEDLPTLVLFMFVPFIVTQFIFDRQQFLRFFRYGVAVHYFFGCTTTLLYIMTGQLYGADGMLATYAIAIPTAFYLYGYFTFSRNNILYLLLAIIGTGLALYSGSRGGLLILIFAFLLGLKPNFASIKSLTVVLFILLFLFLFGNNILKLFVDTRFVELLHDGELSDTDNRVILVWNPVINGILNNPIIGWGSFGDRIFTEGSWAHNMFLEIICDYGIIIGSMFCFWFIIKSIIILLRRDSLLTILFIMAVPQLLFSSSVMRSTYFWIYLGFLLSYGKYKVAKVSYSKLQESCVTKK